MDVWVRGEESGGDEVGEFGRYAGDGDGGEHFGGVVSWDER